ncbi:hypothetical protein [Streptomyces sampsonii]|uniref:hypothetical protein n=1 Tax=Streptomyces sampsonii TaxID=42239 RepID=UPI00210BFA9D|nr:hypothetical protein [Streptomyces sampsonii]
MALRSRAAMTSKRRRAVRYTLDQVDSADDRGLRCIVGRLLVRDGWVDVRGVRVNDSGVVHLVGQRPDGQRLGVAFERGAESSRQDGTRSAAVLRSVRTTAGIEPGETAASVPPALLLVVSPGMFARSRVLWAARTGVRLVDRAMLQRWAAGEDLALLLGLGTEDILSDSA